MPRIIRGRRLIFFTLISLAVSAPAAMALIDDPAGREEEPSPATTSTTVVEAFPGVPTLTYHLDADTGILTLDLTGGVGSEDGDSTGTCLPDQTEEGRFEAEAEPDSPADPSAEDGLVEGCLEVDVTGPNGQINHGSVVSNTVHALQEVRDQLEGPFGQYVRQIAQSGLGMGTEDTAGDDRELDASGDAVKQHGPPAHADRDGPGNGNPPAHSNAGGKGRGR